ncbi:MAG: hypothetical protein AAGA70_18835, partial [Pseudomonadota bacterium]
MTVGEISTYIGMFASIIGAALTILFSRQAKSAAVAAKDASKKTLENIGRINALTELNGLMVLLEDLRNRVSAESWELVSDRAERARMITVP